MQPGPCQLSACGKGCGASTATGTQAVISACTVGASNSKVIRNERFILQLCPHAPAREIPLRDPQTGKPTGAVMTYAEAYAVLYSAYLDAALERDVQRAESTFDSEVA